MGADYLYDDLPLETKFNICYNVAYRAIENLVIIASHCDVEDDWVEAVIDNLTGAQVELELAMDNAQDGEIFNGGIKE